MNTNLKYKVYKGGYIVYEDGTIIGSKGKKLKPKNNGHGYYNIAIYINSTAKYEYIHRIVAKCFIPNPENKMFVNHINGNKKDNRAINLEWCTKSENVRHAYKSGLWDAQIRALKIRCSSDPKMDQSKKVLDTKTGEIYASAKIAAEANNINACTLRNRLNGRCINKTSLIYL